MDTLKERIRTAANMTRIAILAGAWLVWFLGLTALGKGHRQPAVRKDPKARVGGLRFR